MLGLVLGLFLVLLVADLTGFAGVVVIGIVDSGVFFVGLDCVGLVGVGVIFVGFSAGGVGIGVVGDISVVGI